MKDAGRKKQETQRAPGVAAPQRSAEPGPSPVGVDAAVMTAADVLGLQRVAGNRAVNRLTGGSTATHTSAPIQLAPAGGPPEIGLAGGEVGGSLEQDIQRARGGGQRLNDTVRQPMEQAFGADFSGVTVHTDAQSDALNRSISARAFTTGGDIFFRQGEYNPGSDAGKRLIAHELTHTVQQGAAPAQRQVQRQGDAHVSGCGCPSCSSLQRAPDGAALQRHPEEDVIQPLRIQRDAHGPGCGCGSCSGARIQAKLTVGPANDPYEREADRMAASVMRMPLFSRGGMVHRKAAEKIHTHEAPGAIVRQNARLGVLQRHSSWEHQLLGDADPTDLGKIGTWQELIDQTKLEGTFGFRTRKTENAKVTIKGVGEVTKGNVMHIIAQQLQLLSDWQDNPPTRDSGGAIDPKWQTVLVALPGGKEDGSPLIITYGEMNTLADYYGNLEVMKTADKAKRWMVVQSVRQESFFRLKDIYTQLKKSLTESEEGDENVQSAEEAFGGNKRVNQRLGYKFKGAMAPDYISGKAGQVDLLKLGGAGGEGTNEYAATLGRNACHFVPESWHAWSSYHQKARAEARQAWDALEQARMLREFQGEESQPAIEETIANLQTQASAHINEALISNGFGDHYLQDSYAAGHMINKTLIMQWFVQWLDKNKWKMDFAKDENWQKVQAIAYRQPGIASALQYQKNRVQGSGPGQTKNRAMNPQAVEDIPGNDWKKRFDALGLTVPGSLSTPGTPARTLVEWWQTVAGKGGSQEQTGRQLLANRRLGLSDLIKALSGLMQDGVVSWVELSASEGGAAILSGKKTINPNVSQAVFEEATFKLRKEYVPKDMRKFLSARRESQGGDDTQYQRMAAAVTYQDYFAFMNNGYVQKSTNALHDVFCLGGLDVSTRKGEQVFRVYGDDSMFSAQSAKGVQHSAETAHMSRDAIRNIIQSGSDGGVSTSGILERLPSRVQPKGAKTSIGIEAWHNPSAQGQLRDYCESSVFPEMGVIDKAVGVMGDLSKFISKDYNPPHGGEAF